MTTAETLKGLLGRTFCEAIEVRPVPMGLAVRAPFGDNSGDNVTFYVREIGDCYQLEDDGSYLSHLVAAGIDIERGQRRQLLDNILASSGAFWDSETLEIKSRPLSNVGEGAVNFLSALMRVRDLELLTKEVVRSTFREDAVEAISTVLDQSFTIETNAPLSSEFSENPADVVLTPKGGGRKLGVFLVNNPTPFVEAELLHSEIEKEGLNHQFGAAALIEDMPKIQMIGSRRFQRAQNRGLPMPVFRGDEKAAMFALSRASLPKVA